MKKLVLKKKVIRRLSDESIFYQFDCAVFCSCYISNDMGTKVFRSFIGHPLSAYAVL